jgi:hypothetical protein
MISRIIPNLCRHHNQALAGRSQNGAFKRRSRALTWMVQIFHTGKNRIIGMAVAGANLI